MAAQMANPAGIMKEAVPLDSLLPVGASVQGDVLGQIREDARGRTRGIAQTTVNLHSKLTQRDH